MRKVILTVCITASLLLGVVPVHASVKQQKKLAKCVDFYVWELLDEARMEASGSQDGTLYKKALKKLYNGKLADNQKALIAAMNTKGYKEYASKDFTEYISASKVKNTYKQLFGKTPKTLRLRKVSDPGNENGYQNGYAAKGNKVYRLTYDSESDMIAGNGSVKASGSKIVVTRKYSYYSYWGLKANGMAPTAKVTAKVTLKKNKASSYGYTITGLTLQ